MRGWPAKELSTGARVGGYRGHLDKAVEKGPWRGPWGHKQMQGKHLEKSHSCAPTRRLALTEDAWMTAKTHKLRQGWTSSLFPTPWSSNSGGASEGLHRGKEVEEEQKNTRGHWCQCCWLPRFLSLVVGRSFKPALLWTGLSKTGNNLQETIVAAWNQSCLSCSEEAEREEYTCPSRTEVGLWHSCPLSPPSSAHLRMVPHATSFNIHCNLWRRYYCHPHFIARETETERPDHHTANEEQSQNELQALIPIPGSL